MRSLLLCLLLAGSARAGDVEEFTCDDPAGFQTAGADGNVPEGAAVKAQAGRLVLSYERSRISPLAHFALMTEFSELSLTLHADAAGTWVVVLKDRDGATFHHAFSLPGGRWTTVTLRPGDFTLNHDSPVRKPALDPARLGWGWVLIDAAAIRKDGSGIAELMVDTVRITRAPAHETAGDWIVERSQEVRASRRHRGSLIVRSGATLSVEAPRWELEGNLRLEDGASLLVKGGVLHVPQRFHHERTFLLAGTARMEFRDALVVTCVPAKVGMEGAGTFSVRSTECIGGFTVDVPPTATVDLRAALSPGEFVIAPGGKVSVRDSRDVILWLTLGTNFRGTLTVPGDAVAAPWTAGAGHAVTVQNSTGLRWGVVSLPGSDGTLRGSRLTAAGLLFGGKDTVALDRLTNGEGIGSWRVPSPNRVLAFERTTVDAWNVYVTDAARVTVSNSTFGEAMGFGGGRLDVTDSTVDGKGGYVSATGKSELRLTRCRLTCLALARDDATLVLTECVVTGDVRAADRGRVRLVRTEVSGAVVADPTAEITRE